MEEEEATSEASSKDDPYQVNNMMHDMPMQEEGGGRSGSTRIRGTSQGCAISSTR